MTIQEHRNFIELQAISFEEESRTWKDWEARGLVSAEHAQPHIKLGEDRARGSRLLLAVIDSKQLAWN